MKRLNACLGFVGILTGCGASTGLGDVEIAADGADQGETACEVAPPACGSSQKPCCCGTCDGPGCELPGSCACDTTRAEPICLCVAEATPHACGEPIKPCCCGQCLGPGCEMGGCTCDVARNLCFPL